MRAKEFINEAKYGAAVDVPADAKKLPKSQRAAMKGFVSMPDISQTKQGGSPYAQWRFGIAMAGAPDYPTEPAGAFAGDPLLSTYTDVEMDIVHSAAKMIGAGQVNQITNNRSHEADFVNTKSIAKPFKGYKK
jgi:hypothetical protein